MNYPEGYTPHRAPHCGVLAVAIAAGVSFQRAWAELATFQERPGAWKGRTYGHHREAVLTRLGARFTVGTGPRVTVTTFAEKHAEPGKTYVLNLHGHVVTLRDGMVADQNGISPARQHRSSRKIVKRVLRMEGHA